MNEAHIHLVLNHIPVLGSIACVIVLAVALYRRSRDLTVLALVAAIATALLTIPVFLTGEPAEDIVERLPGVSEAVIEPHEEAAEAAFIAMEIAGALALLALVLTFRSGAPSWSTAATMLALLVATALVARTASLGGEIRHTEIRSGAVAEGQAESDD